WTRWAPAEEMLRKIRLDNNVGEPQQVASSEFSAFMKIKATGGLTVSPEQRDALFAEFLQWQQKHGGKQRRGLSSCFPLSPLAWGRVGWGRRRRFGVGLSLPEPARSPPLISPRTAARRGART